MTGRKTFGPPAGWLARCSKPVLGLQWGGNLLLFAFAAAWLQIADSHVWQFAFSVLSAAILVIAFCWLHATTFRLVYQGQAYKVPARSPLWLRLAGFAIAIVLWVLIARWLGSGTDRLWLHAAYWNSRLSPGQRVVFTPARIMAAISALLMLLQWIWLGVMLPVVIELSGAGPSRFWLRRAMRPWRKLLYWIAVIVTCFAGTELTAALVAWMPGTGVKAEITSVVLRLLVAYTFDIVLWCLLLALTVAWMAAREEALEPTR
jgi:hypothetical protein